MKRVPVAPFEAAFPWIKWREPVMVNERFGCRVCIARLGLKGVDVADLPLTHDGFDEHFVAVHA